MKDFVVTMSLCSLALGRTIGFQIAPRRCFAVQRTLHRLVPSKAARLVDISRTIRLLQPHVLFSTLIKTNESNQAPVPRKFVNHPFQVCVLYSVVLACPVVANDVFQFPDPSLFACIRI